MGQVQLIVDQEPKQSDKLAGRDNKGRFAPGHKLSPVINEIKARYLTLRNASLRAVTEHDVNDVVQKILGMAKGGDLGAARLLFQFVISNNVTDQTVEKHDEDMNDVPLEYTQRLKTIHPNLFRITNGRDRGDTQST